MADERTINMGKRAEYQEELGQLNDLFETHKVAIRDELLGQDDLLKLKVNLIVLNAGKLKDVIERYRIVSEKIAELNRILDGK